ncbi:GtrA family protein [Xanthobacter tagetidis]|uniref:GtrA family protein n=1 Tax=Xanthobacter tagetidis TaxID=60216 RepID=A0A3L7AIY9_9HYPH|nr:GtrA family protein [Xanthobacter tagetidis]MBB6309038.1 putative flippase GtrA [Xanthobacter tagetidis]RLP80466.1 GtrA family protein [Xanthobacter tagetidis]
MTSRLAEAWRGSSPWFRLARFLLVGAAASLTYLIVAATLHRLLGLDKFVASLLAYGIAIPVSFIGHKKVTFRDGGDWAGQMVRFALLQAVNIAAVLLAVYVTEPLGEIGYWIGLLLGVALMPLTSFLAMHFLIFISHTRPSG